MTAEYRWKNKILFLTFLFVTVAVHSQQNVLQKRFPLIDRYIDSLMKDWNIPGLALGIVYKDQLVYARGYGYRDLENKLPVLPTTVFPIASNTKLFTATAATLFATEGKVQLDNPVRNYLPSLRFNTDELNAKVTLRDMLSHRTGISRNDGIWLSYPHSRKELITKIALMKPQLGFREGYLYNNMMFTASGSVLEQLSGTTWEEIIRTRFFQPLQMNASCFTLQEMMQSGNYAYSYFEPDSTRRLKRITHVEISDALGPAGTIKSTVEDMSHWMIAQLNAGKYKRQQVIAEEAIRQTLVPNAIADREGKWPELSNSLYGLGRTIQTYKGYKITMHTGSIDGFYSNLLFVPSEQIAVFMVHNNESAGSLRSVMTLPVMDLLLNQPATPWSQRYMEARTRNLAIEKKGKDSINATQVLHTVPSHPLDQFTGKFTSQLYGDLEFSLSNGSLVLHFRGQTSNLYHFHYDQFITREAVNGKPDFRISFLTSENGGIDKAMVQWYGDNAEFIRTEKKSIN